MKIDYQQPAYLERMRPGSSGSRFLSEAGDTLGKVLAYYDRWPQERRHEYCVMWNGRKYAGSDLEVIVLKWRAETNSQRESGE
jgi:hypothetical protein